MQQAAQMDPVDLKTLAQFILLGDPSLQPVATPVQQPEPKGVAAARVDQFARAERRAKLQAVGQFLAETTVTASQREAEAQPAPPIRAALADIARQAGLPGTQPFAAFAIQGAPLVGKSRRRGAKVAVSQPARYHLAVGTPPDSSPKPQKAEPAPVNRGVAVVAKESGGRIVGYRVYHQR